MIRVTGTADLAEFTGGPVTFELEAASVRELIETLDARYPGLGDFVDKRMAIAIDGVIHQDTWFTPLTDGSEVYFFPKIGGG